MKVAVALNATLTGALMGYDWIFDVLEDLKSFAEANGLPALAIKAQEALQVAAQEIADLENAPGDASTLRSGSTH
jgi:hypothetical protein